MKRLITSVALSLALAIGTTACAHKQLTNQQVAKTTVQAAGVAALIGLLIVASSACPDCHVQLTGR